MLGEVDDVPHLYEVHTQYIRSFQADVRRVWAECRGDPA